MKAITQTLTVLAAAAAMIFSTATAQQEQPAAPEKPVVDSERVLVVYYSWSGNTRKAAEYIAEHTGGTLLEIAPAKPYPSDYNACVQQAKDEVQQEQTPAISPASVDLNKYDLIFVGTPNWWSSIAPPVRTFLSKNNFTGKKVALFVTHGSGGMARCEKDALELLRKATPLKGGAFPGATVGEAKKSVTDWVDSIVTIRK